MANNDKKGSGIELFLKIVIVSVLVALAIKMLVNSIPKSAATGPQKPTVVDTSNLRWWYIEKTKPAEDMPPSTITKLAKDVIASKAAVVFAVPFRNSRGENLDVLYQYIPARCPQGTYRAEDGSREGLVSISSVSEGIVEGWYSGRRKSDGVLREGQFTLIREDLGRKRGYSPPR